MKRLLSLVLLAMVLVGALIPGVQASDLPLVVDNAGLMDAEQIQLLEELAQSLRDTYQMDVVILTTNTLDGKTPQAYADDFYDEQGYGCGEDFSGLLLLLSMEDRDWYISTCGRAIDAFTDYGIQQSMSESLAYFSGGSYYFGFAAWLNELPRFFRAYNAGMPIDKSEPFRPLPQEPQVSSQGPDLFFSLFLGVLAGGITLGVMRYSMNTKRSQAGASDYLAQDTYRLQNRMDLFLYSRTRKTPRSSSSSGGGRGGSSTHRSSSGRSHGGRGGKF